MRTRLLGDRGNDGDHGVFEDPAGIKILLGETPVADAVGCEPIEMLERFQHTFAGETVQGPEKQHVKLALTGVAEHGLKLGAVVSLARLVIDVFTRDRPALRGGELAQLAKLIFYFLCLWC